MAGGVPVRDAQAAQMDAIVAAVPMLRRGAPGVRVQMDIGKVVADSRHAGYVIVMCVRDEQVFELKLVFLHQLQHRAGVPAGVEHRRLARDFVPDQVTMHRIAALCRADLPQFPPGAQIFPLRQPTFRNRLQPARVQLKERSQRRELDAPGNLARILKRGQSGLAQSRRSRGGSGGNASHRPGLANDVARMIFQVHDRNGIRAVRELQVAGLQGKSCQIRRLWQVTTIF